MAWEFKRQTDWKHTARICQVIEAFAGFGSRRPVPFARHDLSRRSQENGARLTASRIVAIADNFSGPEIVIDGRTGKVISG